MKVKNNEGKIYDVWKYIKSADGDEHIWSLEWAGNHCIGKDCEWSLSESPVTGGEEGVKGALQEIFELVDKPEYGEGSTEFEIWKICNNTFASTPSPLQQSSVETHEKTFSPDLVRVIKENTKGSAEEINIFAAIQKYNQSLKIQQSSNVGEGMKENMLMAFEKGIMIRGYENPNISSQELIEKYFKPDEWLDESTPPTKAKEYRYRG